SRAELEKLSDHCFDVIFANHVLEHLYDPYTAFEDWQRLLKATGVLLVFVPNVWGENARKLGPRWGPMIGEKHPFAINAEFLFWRQLLAGIGFLSLGEAVTYRIGTLPERESLIRASSFWPALGMSVVILAGGYLLMPFLLGGGRAHLWTLARFYLLYIPFNFVALALLATDQ